MYWKWSFKMVHIFTEFLLLSNGWRLLSISSLIISILFIKASVYFFFLSFNTETSVIIFKLFAAKSSAMKAVQINCRFGLDFPLIAQVQFYCYNLLIIQDFQFGQSLAFCKIIRDLFWASHLSDIMENKHSSDILIQKLKKVEKIRFCLSFYCLDTVFSRDMGNDRKKAKR